MQKEFEDRVVADAPRTIERRVAELIDWLVLFITSADRPFTETERAFLQTIREWGKKILLVVNKIDIFERKEDLDQVLTFVRDAARQQLGIAPETFGVSARLAMTAKRGQPALWQESGFEPLERFIRDPLDEGSRFRLKLNNPLGVAQALATRYAAISEERLVVLRDDVSLLESIESELGVHRDDLARGFELRMTAIEKVLVEMEARGHAFFEDTLRLGRVMGLFNPGAYATSGAAEPDSAHQLTRIASGYKGCLPRTDDRGPTTSTRRLRRGLSDPRRVFVDL